MSEPDHDLAIAQEDYYLPKKDHAPKVFLGVINKDESKKRTLIGSVEHLAAQTPGPKYLLKDSLNKKSNVFSKEPQRGVVFKQQPRPEPGKYEFSKNAVLPRVLQGCQGKSQGSYITRVEKRAARGTPGPKYSPKEAQGHIQTRMFIGNVSKPLLVEERKKQKSFPAPNHYKLNRSVTEPSITQTPAFVKRQKGYIDVITKKKDWVPPPNRYNLIDLNKISRGTKHMSTMGYGRGAVSGFF